MKAMINQMARESHLDVYGLGLDKVKWEEALSRYTELVVKECAGWVNDNVGLIDKEARADLLKHLGVEE